MALGVTPPPCDGCSMARLDTAARRLAVVTVGLGAAVTGACGGAPGVNRSPSQPTTIAAPTTTAPTTTTSIATTTTTTTTTTTSTEAAPSAAVLRPGSRGPAVLAVQQRLATLGYWLGTPDGVFGDSTEQAVYALQKAAGIRRDGEVGPVTAGALARGVVPVPRSTAGHVIEVDLTHQLLMIVTDGTLRWVLNTSTGGGYRYVEDGGSAVADTPVGHFEIYRQVDGLVVDSLGELWRPKFFDAGFAVHGDSAVPPYPVSHGCVRVSNEAIDWIWSAGLAPVGTAVWVYR